MKPKPLQSSQNLSKIKLQEDQKMEIEENMEKIFKCLNCSKKFKNLRNLNQDNRIYVNDIRAKFNQEYYSNDPRQIGYNKTLSSHLDKLGFKDFRNFDSHTGSYFEITIPIFNSIVEQISPQLTIKNSEGKND